MGAGKIILLVFGIIGILISIGLLVSGGTLLWVNSAIKDSEGFYTTRTIEIKNNAHAVVTGPANIDIEAGWLLGNLVNFKVEGSNHDSSTQIFIGVAKEADVDAYLSGVEHDEITSLHIYPYHVNYLHHFGNKIPEDPTSQTFWTASTSGTGTQILEWELKPGSYSLVLMNDDGSAGIDMDIVLGVRVPLLLGISVGLLGGGVIAVSISILMIYLAARKPSVIALGYPKMPTPTNDKEEINMIKNNTKVNDIKSQLKPDSIELVAIWQFIAAFFCLAGLIAMGVFAFPFSPGYEGAYASIGDIYGMTIGTIALIGSLCLFIAGGIGLLKAKSWGRIVSIVSSVLVLFAFPVGTVIGILSLIYLSKPEMREYFEGE